MLASPGTIGKAPSLTTVDLDVSDVVAVTFFMGFCCGAADRGRARYTD